MSMRKPVEAMVRRPARNDSHEWS